MSLPIKKKKKRRAVKTLKPKDAFNQWNKYEIDAGLEQLAKLAADFGVPRYIKRRGVLFELIDIYDDGEARAREERKEWEESYPKTKTYLVKLNAAFDVWGLYVTGDVKVSPKMAPRYKLLHAYNSLSKRFDFIPWSDIYTRLEVMGMSHEEIYRLGEKILSNPVPRDSTLFELDGDIAVRTRYGVPGMAGVMGRPNHAYVKVWSSKL